MIFVSALVAMVGILVAAAVLWPYGIFVVLIAAPIAGTFLVLAMAFFLARRRNSRHACKSHQDPT